VLHVECLNPTRLGLIFPVLNPYAISPCEVSLARELASERRADEYMEGMGEGRGVRGHASIN